MDREQRHIQGVRSTMKHIGSGAAEDPGGAEGCMNEEDEEEKDKEEEEESEHPRFTT